MKQLIRNVRIATMEDGYGLIDQGAVLVDGERIAWVGQESSLPDEHRRGIESELDGNGRLLTPGLIDCHTHLVYGGNRAREFELRLQGADYETIARAGGGILSTVSATREASEQALFESAAQRLQQLMGEGVTCVEIKSGYGLDLETEMKMLRVARTLSEQFPVTVAPTFLGAHALPPEFKDDADGYIDEVCKRMMPAIQSENLAGAVDIFCENIGFTPAQTRRVFECAKSLGFEVKIHAEQLSDQQGASLAAEFQALSADHLEYLSDDGIRAMQKAGTVATLLPGAFYFLRETRLPPIDALRKAGVPMAIATDSNPGTSPTTSLLLMLNMAATLFRLTPLECLQGVTVNGARALGLERNLGTVAAKKQADLVLWNVGDPAELTYNFGANPCYRIFRKGQQTGPGSD